MNRPTHDTPELQTERLRLIPGTAELGRAEIEDRRLFGRLLEAEVPAAWPPPLNDEGSMTWFTEYVEANPEAVGWAAWYFLQREADGGWAAVGNGGFKGLPDETGTVEIGYSILEAHQRQGLAPEAVGALIGWAFSHEAVGRIVAQTLPGLRPSIRVLEKCGFSFVGPGFEDGAVLYELIRGKQVRRRLEHEPPQAVAEWGWRYHHLGIPTDEARPGEVHLMDMGMHVSGFESSPYGVEWMRFGPSSPIHELIRTVPHVAFEVDDLKAALVGKTLLGEPSSPMPGVTVAMILHNGMPVELLEFSDAKPGREES